MESRADAAARENLNLGSDLSHSRQYPPTSLLYAMSLRNGPPYGMVGNLYGNTDFSTPRLTSSTKVSAPVPVEVVTSHAIRLSIPHAHSIEPLVRGRCRKRDRLFPKFKLPRAVISARDPDEVLPRTGLLANAIDKRGLAARRPSPGSVLTSVAVMSGCAGAAPGRRPRTFS